MAAASNNTIRVLGVVGSPRIGGNTDVLVDAVLAGAEESGATCRKIQLSTLDIAPCRACEACAEAGRCVFDDDMQEVLDLMDESAIWVLGTPVYFWGPTGWFKAFIDRWYGARHHINFANKRVILAIPFEDTKTETARHTVGMLKDTLDYVKAELTATLVVPGVLHRGEVNNLAGILAAAHQAGKNAVASI